MDLRCTDRTPPAAAFKTLYDSTGWGPRERGEAFYAQALAGSWCCCAVWDGERLVGFGRVISDGRLHAFVTEMIVAPAWQQRGVGRTVLQALLARCHAAGITDIQLFCAEGKAGFYERHGFVARAPSRPGMQFVPQH
ncbi:GNAT family N-acetyltransferase [Rubrivivax gelatinosus]|nr:GNAT family N-acetyltransferase [Rubrivivax gelatinosus]